MQILDTNGTALSAQVAVVNGGIAPEAGDLVGEWGITLEAESGTIQLETATGPGEVKQERSL